MLIGLMSLQNQVVYIQFHPVAYMVKLNIEMSMAGLITKLARNTVTARPDELDDHDTSHIRTRHDHDDHTRSSTFARASHNIDGKTLYPETKFDSENPRSASGDDDIQLTPFPRKYAATANHDAGHGDGVAIDREGLKGIHTTRQVHVVREVRAGSFGSSGEESVDGIVRERSAGEDEFHHGGSEGKGEDDEVPLKREGREGWKEVV